MPRKRREPTPATENAVTGSTAPQNAFLEPVPTNDATEEESATQGATSERNGMPSEAGSATGTVSGTGRRRGSARVVRPRRARTAQAGRIGREEILKARTVLQKYKDGKARLEDRIIENERWWKMQHWEQLRRGRPPKEVEPTSAWLFNSIANKHADAMDNYPEPSVLPREEGDAADAEALGAILPAVLEENGYEQTYSDTWWYKLKTGTGVNGVFWNPRKAGGLGDVSIEKVDLLDLFWEPGVTDIQKSRNLFHVRLTDNETLEEQYPDLKGKLGGASFETARYIYDEDIDTSDKSAVVDWYYKLWDGGRQALHFVKFVNEELLYASENDPEYAERGFYDHGEYPFVFDTLFPEEGSPAGFGYIDVMKDTQRDIDRMNQATMKNMLMSSSKRYFIRQDGSVNEEEFADWNRDLIHVQGNLGEDSIRELPPNPQSSLNVQMIQLKIDELKETSGNRDFSQGGTANGVTAASAIAALQEAGSKLSRDMLSSSYRAFTETCYLVLELIRQFYDEPRQFRIIGTDGREGFVTYDNAAIQPRRQEEAGVDLGVRAPIFDIKVRAQRASAFSRLSQNELALQFYQLGFFNPQMADQALMCMEMMDFEGKDALVRKIARRKAEADAAARAQTIMAAQMRAAADAQTGSVAPIGGVQPGGALG